MASVSVMQSLGDHLVTLAVCVQWKLLREPDEPAEGSSGSERQKDEGMAVGRRVHSCSARGRGAASGCGALVWFYRNNITSSLYAVRERERTYGARLLLLPPGIHAFNTAAPYLHHSPFLALLRPSRQLPKKHNKKTTFIHRTKKTDRR